MARSPVPGRLLPVTVGLLRAGLVRGSALTVEHGARPSRG